MKTFVVHYAKLVERKEFQKQQLATQGIEPTFVEQYDRDTLTEQDVAMFHNIDRSNMAICLSHLECMKQIAVGNDDYALILEDDAVLAQTFSSSLASYMEQLPGTWDFLFLGNGCDLHIHPSVIAMHPRRNVFVRSNFDGDGSTRCLDSYVVRRAAAQKLLAYVETINYKVSQPVDWWFNRVFRDINAEVYWAEPTIVHQGSEHGMYTSSHK